MCSFSPSKTMPDERRIQGYFKRECACNGMTTTKEGLQPWPSSQVLEAQYCTWENFMIIPSRHHSVRKKFGSIPDSSKIWRNTTLQHSFRPTEVFFRLMHAHSERLRHVACPRAWYRGWQFIAAAGQRACFPLRRAFFPDAFPNQTCLCPSPHSLCLVVPFSLPSSSVLLRGPVQD